MSTSLFKIDKFSLDLLIPIMVAFDCFVTRRTEKI